MANGTSFAAPQVAGAAAILLQRDPNLTPDQIKWLLRATGRSVTGSAAPALDIAGALAYAGIVGSANQGIPLAASPTPAASRAGSSVARLVTDAVAAQRAALEHEASSAWRAAGAQWRAAGDLWTKASSPVAAATAYDNAARDDAAGGSFRDAATAWLAAAAAVRRAGLVAWEPVAVELAARALMGAGTYAAAGQTMERAARLWAAGLRPPCDRGRLEEGGARLEPRRPPRESDVRPAARVERDDDRERSGQCQRRLERLGRVERQPPKPAPGTPAPPGTARASPPRRPGTPALPGTPRPRGTRAQPGTQSAAPRAGARQPPGTSTLPGTSA